MSEKAMEMLQKKIGYRFRDLSLLRQALSHSSYANEHRQENAGDNERLEFLGDAVLELSSSEFLFLEYPQMPEGDMTKLRASLVCEPTLALCARDIGLPEYLLLGKGEEHTGGRHRDSIVSDAMEALIGAIYLDGGFASAKEFVRKFILTDIEHKKLFYDSKTILQEIVQRDYKEEEVAYVLTGEEVTGSCQKIYCRGSHWRKNRGNRCGKHQKGCGAGSCLSGNYFSERKNGCI